MLYNVYKSTLKDLYEEKKIQFTSTKGPKSQSFKKRNRETITNLIN